MHAHRIDVLDGTDDHEVVGDITHHLQLKFLPTDHRFLNENFVHRAQFNTASDNLTEFLHVVGDTTTNSTQRERWPDNGGKAEPFDNTQCLVKRFRVLAGWHLYTDRFHGVPELQSILSHHDGLDRRPDEGDAKFFEHSVRIKLNSEIQRRLPTNRRKECIGTFPLNHRPDTLPGQWLDISTVRDFRIRHNRRGIGINQHNLQAFGAQCLARLCTRIVELASLSDHYRSRP